VRHWRFLFAVLIAAPASAVAAPSDELKEMIAACEGQQSDLIQCERDIWNFADVTKDGNLSSAEMARVWRAFAEIQDEKWKSSRGKEIYGELGAFFFSPIINIIVLQNFDYNNDGLLSRDELYYDLPEGRFDLYVNQLEQSGKDVFEQANKIWPGLEWPLDDKKEVDNSLERDVLVEMIQDSLTEMGYEVGPTDGILGPATVEAIIEFQRRNGLPQTGEPSWEIYLHILDAEGNETTEAPEKSGQAGSDDPIGDLLSAMPNARSQSLTPGEIDNIRSQIQKNWSLPAGAQKAHDLTVTLRILLNPDGGVADVLVIDETRMRSDPLFRATAESAVRAVLKTERIRNLPPEKYDQWRDMRINFDPREMLSRIAQ
jgi:hypothetical protein